MSRELDALSVASLDEDVGKIVPSLSHGYGQTLYTASHAAKESKNGATRRGAFQRRRPLAAIARFPADGWRALNPGTQRA
jgi:hypothetical protein